LFESIARIARHEARARASSAIGRVVEVYPAGEEASDHAVDVELRDSGVLLPRVPLAVGVLGFAAMPPVGSLVLVLFADGEHDAPVVVGRLYHADEPPPAHETGQIVLRLPSGSSEPKLQLEVDGALPSATIELTGDVRVELVEEQVNVTIGQGDDAMKLMLTGRGGGRAELAAGRAHLVIRRDGDIELSTPGNLRVQGANVEVTGSQLVRIAGPRVELN
jgi:uncharacterized protein involved in type VI secretion and phage assembly